MKKKIKSHLNTEDAVFWKWVSDTPVGLIVDSAVFHWTINDAASPPTKIFNCHPTLAGTQIINYRNIQMRRGSFLSIYQGTRQIPHSRPRVLCSFIASTAGSVGLLRVAQLHSLSSNRMVPRRQPSCTA